MSVSDDDSTRALAHHSISEDHRKQENNQWRDIIRKNADESVAPKRVPDEDEPALGK